MTNRETKAELASIIDSLEGIEGDIHPEAREYFSMAIDALYDCEDATPDDNEVANPDEDGNEDEN